MVEIKVAFNEGGAWHTILIESQELCRILNSGKMKDIKLASIILDVSNEVNIIYDFDGIQQWRE